MAANAMERLDLALEASNEGIWDWDFESGTIDFTQRIGDFFGCAREEVPNFFEDPGCIHKDDRELFLTEIEAVKAGRKEILAVEPRIATLGEKGNEWKFFRVRGVPVKHQGKLTGLAGSMIDISLRKRAEQAFLDEQHLTQTLVENVPLQIYFKDLNSRFTMVNSPMARWMGQDSPEALIGKSDADFFDEAHWRKALEDEQRILETGEALESVVEKESWSGRADTWVLTSKMPYRNRRGKLTGTFGISSDVSELVRTQRSLAEMAAELKERNQAYEEEMALAREIQQGLLPREYPAIGSASFGNRYLPISGLAGDFFEVLDLGEDQVGLLISDVMGHGVRSALIASLLRGLVGQFRSLADRPDVFFEAVNDGLVTFLKQAGVTMFATAFYVVVDFKKGKIRYASAGHPAGIVSDGSGASLLPLGGRGKGPGLGLIPAATYGCESIPLAGVRKIILFTDGIFEVENPEGEAFLQNRLVETVANSREMGLEELLDNILEKVKTFTAGDGFDDDVCLLGMSL